VFVDAIVASTAAAASTTITIIVLRTKLTDATKETGVKKEFDTGGVSVGGRLSRRMQKKKKKKKKKKCRRTISQSIDRFFQSNALIN
jgi:hypothetical protein